MSKKKELMPVSVRAVVALGMKERETELTKLAASTADITAITNPDGYKQVRAARIALKNVRLEIQATGKQAREDATAFSKAVIVEEKRLVALIEPEEERLGALQDAEDARIEAERQAEIEREVARQAALQKRVDEIRALPNGATRQAAAQVQERIEAARATVVDESFEELQGIAAEALANSIHALIGIHVERVAHETEQKRIADERAELARLRAEAAQRAKEEAERERQAKAARDAEAARHAAQLRQQAEDAERERRERQRLIDEENDRKRAALAAEEKRQADARAEIERQQEELRKAQEPSPTGAVLVEVTSDGGISAEHIAPPAPTRFDVNDSVVPTRDEIIVALCAYYGEDVDVIVGWLAQYDWRAALAEAA